MHFDVKKTRRWEDTTREVVKKPALSPFSGVRLAVEIVQEMEKRRKAEVQAKEEKAIAGSNGLGLLQDAVALRVTKPCEHVSSSKRSAQRRTCVRLAVVACACC